MRQICAFVMPSTLTIPVFCYGRTRLGDGPTNLQDEETKLSFAFRVSPEITLVSRGLVSRNKKIVEGLPTKKRSRKTARGTEPYKCCMLFAFDTKFLLMRTVMICCVSK